MSKSKSFLINLAIMLVLFVVVSMLPPFGGITEVGMKVLGAFVAIVYGWIVLDITYTSIIGFVLLGLTGLFTPLSALIAAFSNQTVLMTLIVGAFATGLSKLGVGELVVNFMLSRKIVVGHPWILVVMFCIIAGIFGLTNNALLGFLLLFTIAGEMARSRGYEDKSMFMTFMFCIIIYCATMFPGGYGAWLPIMIMFGGMYTAAVPVVISYAEFFILGLIFSVVFVALFCLIAKFVFRIDVSKFTLTEEDRLRYAANKAPKKAKIATVCLAVFIFLIVLPVFCNPSNPVIAFINNIGIIGWAIIFTGILAALRDEEDKPLLDIVDMFASAPWAAIMLIAVTIPLGNAMSSADVGIMATMIMYVQPIIASMGIIGMYIFVFVFLGVITQFTHNFVAGAIFLPLFGNIGVNIGADPVVLFFVMFTALNASFATPAASMNSGILYGMKEVNTKWAYIFGWLTLALVGLCIVLLWPLVNILL